jgi:glycosyltransferase involved in cell wall biosynthesis
MRDEATPSSKSTFQENASSLAGRRVLYISYNGMLDPLGQSQVLPYLRELAGRGVKLTLLSFERAHALAASGETKVEKLRTDLVAHGIEWHWLRYHQTPSLPATMFDVMNGVRLGKRLVRKNKIEMVHARSHIPATIALALKRKLGIRMIFDVRGLMADEYVDANHWQKNSFSYRLTKTIERRALAGADGVVTLTKVVWPIIKDWDGLRRRTGVAHAVIPCCADLSLFRFSVTDRERRRQQLGLNNQLVLVYSGSIDGWYLTEEMADFFAAILKRNSNAHALWLTPSRHDRIRSLMEQRGLDASRYSVVAAASQDVPSYLSAGDVGIAFIKPCFSKLASSPTKYAEYLGCGLPLVINAGIGDSDSLISQEHAGVLIREFTPAEYEKAAGTIEGFMRDQAATRELTRAIAERLFDVSTVGVESYAHLYEAVFRS